LDLQKPAAVFVCSYDVLRHANFGFHSPVRSHERLRFWHGIYSGSILTLKNFWKELLDRSRWHDPCFDRSKMVYACAGGGDGLAPEAAPVPKEPAGTEGDPVLLS
jgi:hypothetical protein